MHDLAQLHQEIAFAGIVEINNLWGTDEYELKIKCVLDAHGRKSINEFLEKKDLKIREEEGFIIIFK